MSISALFALFAGCGADKRYLLTFPEASQSRGVVQVEEIEGGNRLVAIVVEGLAQPNVPPNRGFYVAWLTNTSPGADAAPHIAGLLAYDAGRQEGRLLTTTPLRSFDLLITKESSSQPPSPGDIVVAVGHIPD